MRCHAHPFDRAADICSQCGGNFCGVCVVFPFGERRPAVCKECALVMAGVRRGRRRRNRPISTRELKRRRLHLREQLAAEPVGMFRYLDMVPIPDITTDPNELPKPRGQVHVEWCA
jgi:hypothetical protein